MAKTHAQYVSELNGVNSEIEVIGQYTKSTERIRVRCRRCGKVWEPLAYSLLDGKSCSHCSAIRGAKAHNGRTALKTKETFEAQLKEVDDSIQIIGEYENTHTNITCSCARCSHVWSAKPYSLLQGHGCPRCAKSGTSFMEQFIRLCFEHVLGGENVISRDRKYIGMELDIVIPTYNIAIEPGSWNLHRRSIDKDLKKRKLCEDKGIRLFTIYDMFPEEEPKPFDCITYSVDLNKADHSLIRSLVDRLFSEIGIEYIFSDEEFAEIESEAYSNSKATTHEEFVAKIKRIHPNLTVLGTFRNTNVRVSVKCLVCGFEWDGVPANMLAGDGCRKCGSQKAHQKFVRDHEDFVIDVAKANPDVEILGKYTGRHSPVQVKCRICGYVWEPRASSLLRGSTHKGAKTMHKENIQNI